MVKKVCPRCLSKHPQNVEDCPNPIYDEDYQDEEILEPRKPTISPARVRISELLKCPIDWERIAPGHSICVSLERYWKEIASECLLEGTGLPDYVSTDPADLKISDISDMTEEDFDEIRQIYGETFDEYFKPLVLELADERDLLHELPYIEAWIERSRARYKELVYRFERMHMANEREYHKHFPAPNLSTKEVRRRTTNGPSLFYKGVTPERLEDLMWVVLGDIWRQLLEGPHANVYVNCCTTIGATKGRDTVCIYFDIDFSTPITHAYPVLETDIPNNELILGLDDLQGYVEIDS